MKKIICLVFVLIIGISLKAQNINGRFSSSIYSFERFDSLNTSDTYFRTFQSLYLNINKSNFSIKTRINFEADIANPLDNDPRLRFYNLYFEARKVFDVATVKIGRLPLFNNVAGGIFDGADVTVNSDKFTVNGFYGGSVPAYQKLKLIDNFSDNYILGGKLTYKPINDLKFGLNYIDKNFKAQSYEAIRLDANNDPITVLVQQKSNQYRFVSADVSYFKENLFSAYTRLDFDMNLYRASKFEISGRYDQIENLGLSLYYNYREPNIRYNSIFAVFNFGNTQEIEAGADYRIGNLFTFFGKVAHVIYNDETSQRVSFGINSNYGGVSYRKNLGYAGEMDAFSIYGAHSFFDGLLTPSIGISYTGYKLSTNSDKLTITSLMAGVNFKPVKTLSFDLQSQYFNNKIYKNDLRVLFKINYWFNTNLKLI